MRTISYDKFNQKNNHYLEKKRHNYLTKKYCKRLNQRAKLVRIANKLIGLP